MKESAFWIVIVILACFIGPLNRDRYQATSIGSRAFIVDKHTGEVWTTIKRDENAINKAGLELVPVQYESRGQWSFRHYVPEESRSDDNAELSSVISRKWSQLTKKKDPNNLYDESSK